ncbi:hypothetical protein [Nonomuraea longicatena]|uniref:Uncharacterized protein n=1 Tax=Nonomuraea longicatena TaxID=83682 RepID=A0ABP4AP52_9ACTN
MAKTYQAAVRSAADPRVLNSVQPLVLAVAAADLRVAVGPQSELLVTLSPQLNPHL